MPVCCGSISSHLQDIFNFSVGASFSQWGEADACRGGGQQCFLLSELRISKS